MIATRRRARRERPLSFAMESVADHELARLREMTASEKIAVMHSLWRQAWALKRAGIRAQHPDWSAEQVETGVREVFRDGAR